MCVFRKKINFTGSVLKSLTNIKLEVTYVNIIIIIIIIYIYCNWFVTRWKWLFYM